MISWGQVCSEQYRREDIQRDMKRLHVADQATNGDSRPVRKMPFYPAVISFAFALFTRMSLHITWS